jgi:hypothetical protein
MGGQVGAWAAYSHVGKDFCLNETGLPSWADGNDSEADRLRRVASVGLMTVQPQPREPRYSASHQMLDFGRIPCKLRLLQGDSSLPRGGGYTHCFQGEIRSELGLRSISTFEQIHPCFSIGA